MQATISSFDPVTGAGSLLLDDGVELGFGPQALADTGLRLLRPGQRVRLDTTGEGADLAVLHLQILTLS